MKYSLILFSSLVLGTLAGPAFAADPKEDQVIKEAERTETLPPPQSDTDRAPPVSTPDLPKGGVVEQAGRGGVMAYGRAGVIELGGSASLNAASDYFRVSVQPSIGYFVLDNVELSALLGVSYVDVTTKNDAGVDESASQVILTVLAEPSVHVPFTQTLFGFLGVGMGLSYADEVGAGFALQPRLGLNITVGRSGILSPAVYVQYSTHSAIETAGGTLLSVSFGYGLNIGYTVMW